jgi:hypothetical protein
MDGCFAESSIFLNDLGDAEVRFIGAITTSG